MDRVPAFANGKLAAETPRPDWAPVLKRLKLAESLASDPVLDMGAGTGWLTMHLALWGYDVTAADLSEEAMAIYERNMATAGFAVPVEREDVTHLTYDDERFGSVFAFSLLEHVANLGQALAEIRRVLKPGGLFVAGVPNAFGTFSLIYDHDPRSWFSRTRRGDIRMDHEHLHGPRWWRHTLEDTGFSVDRVVKLEVLTPLFARLMGYDRAAPLTRFDCRAADFLPAAISSDLLFVTHR